MHRGAAALEEFRVALLLLGAMRVEALEVKPPLWGFDGSSTQQAEGRSSDCVLKPVAIYPDSTRTNGAIVMCEVMMPDGTTRDTMPPASHLSSDVSTK
mgnify:CR=1 FL=1